MLRVTGGTFRGMLLYCPRDIRPTAGRIKEYIFSQVSEFAPGARVIDIFAGSGALGIEALSRKAREAVFLDKSVRSVTIIKRNLQKIGVEGMVLKADALRYINNFKKEPFDLIFLDPPYRDYEPSTLIQAIEKSEILQKGGHVVYEINAGLPQPESQILLPNSFRTLGDTSIGIWFRPD